MAYFLPLLFAYIVVTRTSTKRQTRREAGTQSHGPLPYGLFRGEHEEEEAAGLPKGETPCIPSENPKLTKQVHKQVPKRRAPGRH